MELGSDPQRGDLESPSPLAQLVYVTPASSPHLTSSPRVQVRKYGEQKKLFISPGLLPEVPSKPGLPKSEHPDTPKVDGGESGWLSVGREGRGWPGLLHAYPIPIVRPFVHLQIHPPVPSRDHHCARQGQGNTHSVPRRPAGLGKPWQEGGRHTPGGDGCSMEVLCSPQGINGKDQELVLGLGHLNNSYNFSVSVPGCPQPLPSSELGGPST